MAKFSKILRVIINVAQLITSAVLIFVVYSLNIVPDKYMIGLSVFLFALYILFTFMMFFVNKKKKYPKIRITISSILSVVLSIVLGVGSVYVNKTDNAVDLLTSGGFQQRAISVIVLEDSEIKTEQDIPDKNIGYVSTVDVKTAQYAINEISTKLGTIKTSEIADYNDLADALYQKKVDAIILDESFRDIVNEYKENFNEETRVVYQVTKTEEAVVSNEAEVTKEPFLVYISGNDKFGEMSAVSRSDVNMLAAVNPTNKQILLISIPRDTYFPLHLNGQYDKFTHSGLYGIQESINTLQDMLHEEINYYARMNFTSFINIVDALGGIEIYSPKSFVTVKGKYHIQKGMNKLNAEQALSFVRERKAFGDGDFARGRNQQRMVSAIIKKVCSPAIITSFSSILDTISTSVETNMSRDEINALLQMQLSDMAEWDIQNFQIKGTPCSRPCYSAGNRNASVVVPDENSLVKATEYIDTIMEGETLKIEDEVKREDGVETDIDTSSTEPVTE